MLPGTVEISIGRNGEARSAGELDDAVLSSGYPVHGPASEVNRSGADARIVSCHGYLVFHPFVEQLTIFYISGLVLASSSKFYPPSLDLDLHRDGIISVMCKKGTTRNSVYFNRKPVTERQT